MTAVVYEIINSATGFKYIGSTYNFKTRKATHINSLRKGNHVHKQMQSDFKWYGEVSFQIREVETFNDYGAALKRERELILETEKVYNRQKVKPKEPSWLREVIRVSGRRMEYVIQKSDIPRNLFFKMIENPESFSDVQLKKIAESIGLSFNDFAPIVILRLPK